MAEIAGGRSIVSGNLSGCWFNLLNQFNLLSLLAGAMKLANKAALWYVPCSLQNVEKITEVPPIKVEYVGNLAVAGFPFYFPTWLCCVLLFDLSFVENIYVNVTEAVCLLMCVLCVVCECRAGGGGQKTL